MSPSGGAAFKAVSIGGGTGQPNSIRALRRLGCQVSAVVSMVDDGGSTGILREKAHIVPPGDLRKCMVAMAADPSSPLCRAAQHRFPFADNHALGNLVIDALAEETGSFEEALRIFSGLLGCVGPVYPSTLDDVVLWGVTRDGREVHGQVALGTWPCALSTVRVEPENPRGYQPAVDAIMQADLVVLGPGSLYTSVIPNLLVPDVLDAIRRTRACRVYVCSLADMQGETRGLSAHEYVEALLDHGMEGALDVVLLHDPAPSGEAARPTTDEDGSQVRPIIASPEQVDRIRAMVPHVMRRDFSDPLRPTWHDPGKLASALREVIETCRSPR